MENRLEVQNIQDDELYMDLTAEELKELEQMKGGSGNLIYKPLTNRIPVPSKPFPLGIVEPFPNGIPVPFPNVISEPSISTNQIS